MSQTIHPNKQLLKEMLEQSSIVNNAKEKGDKKTLERVYYDFFNTINKYWGSTMWGPMTEIIEEEFGKFDLKKIKSS